MTEPMSPVDLNDTKIPASSVSPISDDEKAQYHITEYEEPRLDTQDGLKPEDPLLGSKTSQAPKPDEKAFVISEPNSKGSFPKPQIDEEKHQTGEPQVNKALERKKRVLDLAQRVTSLILSIIILAVMAHAYVVFLHNKDVTHEGIRIYPTFMQLWPTYMMITAGAMTVLLNLLIVAWRIHGTVRDLTLIEQSGKYWDYAVHGINFVVWLASTTSFKVTKNWGPAADPNVLWGYVCSPTAQQLNASYPEIIRFYVQCNIQTVSFWMSVSAIIVEGFTILAKLFLR